MTTEDTTITSGRALARAVNRSRSAVAEWIARPSWPFGPPPWPATVAHEALRWADKTLGGDRTRHERERAANLPPDAEPEVDAPGVVVTTADMIDPASPFALQPVLGPTLFSALTTKDLDAFATAYLFAFAWIMDEQSQATGRGPLKLRAPFAYYHDLYKQAPWDLVTTRLNGVLAGQIGMTFEKRGDWRKLMDAEGKWGAPGDGTKRPAGPSQARTPKRVREGRGKSIDEPRH